MSQKYQATNLVQILLGDFQKMLEEFISHDRQALMTIDLPPVDLLETESFIIVKTDLPGIDPEELQVQLVKDRLIIRGIKEEPPLPGRVNFLCMERSFGPFQRVVILGRPVDPKEISAVYRRGCLVVKLKKMAERRGRPISIPIQFVPSESLTDKKEGI